MPELPEVRTVVKFLSPRLVDLTITDVWVGKPKMIKEVSVAAFKTAVINQRITKITNHAKFLAFHLASGTVMLSHLRMEGKYHFVPYDDATHDHVVFSLSSGEKLYYNDTRQFGTFHLRDEKTYLYTPPLSQLGPEPSRVNPATLYHQLQRKKIAIKSALLDQTIISGLGNIYVDEVLWTIKIHPLVPAQNLDLATVTELVKAARRVINQATRLGGTMIRSYVALDQSVSGYQDFLKVHMQAQKPCPRCHALIQKIKVNGRGTYFCPHEQRY